MATGHWAPCPTVWSEEELNLNAFCEGSRGGLHRRLNERGVTHYSPLPPSKAQS